jgi:hypothetical protein
MDMAHGSSGDQEAVPYNESPPRLQNPRRNLNLFFLGTTTRLLLFHPTTPPEHRNTTNTRALRSSRCAQAPLEASRRSSDPLSLFSPPSRQQPLPPLAAVSSGPIPLASKFPLPHSSPTLHSNLAPQFSSAERSSRRLGSKRRRAQGVRRYSSLPIAWNFFYPRSLGLFISPLITIHSASRLLTGHL